MNNFIGCLDTDAAIGSILSNFETPWVMNTIHDSLNMKFRPFDNPLPNYVDILHRQFNNISIAGIDYKEKIESVRIETYKEIIEVICEYYGLVFTENLDELNIEEAYGITRTLYDIFISRFTDYMINFYITYILQNVDSIYNYLEADPETKKIKDKEKYIDIYSDQKIMLIHANLNKVILNMISYDIPLDTLLSYFLDNASYSRISLCLKDTGDIYRNHYANYLLDQRYMADMLTCIKLRLQAKTTNDINLIANLKNGENK